MVDYCHSNGLRLIIGADANAHNVVWGSSDTNIRGKSLLEYIISSDLYIANKSNKPTFVTSNRSEVIDITIANGISISAVSEWKVSSEVPMSDHKWIYFNVDLDKKKMKKTVRNARRTNWESFQGQTSCS